MGGARLRRGHDVSCPYGNEKAQRFPLRWKMSRVASRAGIIAAEKYGYRQTVKLRWPR